MLKRQHTIWSEEDDDALRRLALTMSLTRLALRLGRTQYAVKRRASDLRIKLLSRKKLNRAVNNSPRL